ncbi:Protein kinase domain family protein [Aspergillus niger]|uniref:Protein kinase domain family protein n=1 Tax=Aspergillus niger TaxID=5061 RepID=A0A505I2Z4_ASPNG|nr:Protein kinase domain family protein [Aspergillus niger]
MASFWVAESAGYESHGWRKRKGGKIRDGAFQRMQQVVIWVDWVPGYDAGMRSEESWRAYYVHTRSSYARLC